MMEMKEHLLAAIQRRKQNIVPAALNIFNKIQEKQYKVEKLDEFPKITEAYEVENIDETLTRLRKLVDDPRSPIVSALLETEAYYYDAP